MVQRLNQSYEKSKKHIPIPDKIDKEIGKTADKCQV